MPNVFISYLHDNKDTVLRLRDELKANGVEVWIDCDSIEPGAFWKDAIRNAVREGDFFIACFSEEYNVRSSTDMNEELYLAIDELRLRTTDQKWFIPVLLSPCEVPDIEIGARRTLRDIQWVELYKDWKGGIQKILKVIKPAQRPEKPPDAELDIRNRMLILEYESALNGHAWQMRILEYQQKARDHSPRYVERQIGPSQQYFPTDEGKEILPGDLIDDIFSMLEKDNSMENNKLLLTLGISNLLKISQERRVEELDILLGVIASYADEIKNILGGRT